MLRSLCARVTNTELVDPISLIFSALFSHLTKSKSVLPRGGSEALIITLSFKGSIPSISIRNIKDQKFLASDMRKFRAALYLA